MVVYIIGISDGIRPQCSGDGIWPLVSGVKELYSGLILQVSNALFSSGILPVSIDTTEAERLS